MGADERLESTVAEVLQDVALQSEPQSALLRSQISGLEYDSRRVEPGFLFFAFPGAKTDGRQYAAEAVERGAVAVVSEAPDPSNGALPWIQAPHGRVALALACKRFYRSVDERLGITGVTGTNGKTTTSLITDAVLRAAGRTTALIGTIEYRLAGEILPSVNTTPESLDLYRLFARLEAAGGTHVTMEVSSHALALGRVQGIYFHTAVFTNFTRDHLDFHGTMEDYFAAKQRLFTPEFGRAPRCAAINGDDPWGSRIRTGPGTQVLRYGFGEDCDVRASGLSTGFEGTRFEVRYREQTVSITSGLVGRINAYNILAAICAGLSYGLDWHTIAAGIADCRAVPGRFERVDEGQPFLVVVDYAHTDDALRNVIAVARGLGPKRILTLFGCGGDRDRSKRPLMGMAAGEGSDFVVLTSDNPRSEDPLEIMMDALVGLRRFDTPHVVEPDREKAIRAAIEEAREGDIVILAGKGHEPYQVLREGTVAFDDREVVRTVLRELGYGGPARPAR